MHVDTINTIADAVKTAEDARGDLYAMHLWVLADLPEDAASDAVIAQLLTLQGDLTRLRGLIRKLAD